MFEVVSLLVLFNFINLTQVHNFTVGAQAILPSVTVSFTGLLQVLMQVMRSSVRVYLGFLGSFYLYSIRLISFIINIPRPLRNEILDHSTPLG